MRKSIIVFLLLLSCACRHHGHLYNGYIDADLTYLSSDYPGRLTHLLVHRGDSVQKDQPLFSLEKTSEHFNVQISQLTQDNLLAQRAQLQDQLTYAEINYPRTLKMKAQNAASQNDLDLAKRDLDALKDQIAAIDFQIRSSHIDTENRQWQLSRKENHATEAGIIFDTYFTQDEYVQAGQPVLALITHQHIKAIFFVPERELSQLALGQKVQISTDGSTTPLIGTINYISNNAQYTSPLIYSREDRQEIAFRVEAHIDQPDLRHVHLGQPFSLEVMP